MNQSEAFLLIKKYVWTEIENLREEGYADDKLEEAYHIIFS